MTRSVVVSRLETHHSTPLREGVLGARRTRTGQRQALAHGRGRGRAMLPSSGHAKR